MPDVYMAPGGHVEFTEGLFECARREIMEETGISIKNIRVKAVGMAYLEDLKREFYLHLLIADYESGDLIQNPEDGELVWLTKEEMLRVPKLLSELKEVIPYIFDESDKVISYKVTYESGNNMTKFELESSE